MISPSTDPIGIEIVDAMAEIGFDYLELSLADLAALPEAAFVDLARRLERFGLRCEACNNFFPRTVRLTGEDARLPAALEYARLALDRAARLGARVVVFGSSGAKNVPEGFSPVAAWHQIVALLRHLGPIAAACDLTIAIEPINRLESNIVNRAEEGLRLAREVGHPQVKLLIDFYHLKMERECLAILEEAGPEIRHVHFAEVERRAFPEEAKPEYADFFTALHRIRYEGRCSLEAYTQDFAIDARRALEILQSLVKQVK
jgi:sugar phosphate isomerase/epimerase